jgi:CheY-like chemotaxis protein
VARILVIDDDPQLRRLLRRYFERYDHVVSEAADGDEGLTRFHAAGADVIITDLIMPGKEGMETILELRQDNPEVKVIAISGGGRVPPEGYLKLAKGIGASRVFSKPFELADLHRAVEELTAGETS